MTNFKNQKLIESILKLMPLSSMDDNEKATWTILAPSLSTEDLTNLKTALEDEVEGMTDIYLNVLKNQKTT